jgi:hypothetical protein
MAHALLVSARECQHAALVVDPLARAVVAATVWSLAHAARRHLADHAFTTVDRRVHCVLYQLCTDATHEITVLRRPPAVVSAVRPAALARVARLGAYLRLTFRAPDQMADKVDRTIRAAAADALTLRRVAAIHTDGAHLSRESPDCADKDGTGVCDRNGRASGTMRVHDVVA